jgi:hypothetical protein
MDGNARDWQVMNESHEVERQKTNRNYGKRSSNRNAGKM